MKILTLKIKDSVYERFKSFLEIFPKDTVKVVEEPDLSHIEYIDEEEQKEIELILKDSDSK